MQARENTPLNARSVLVKDASVEIRLGFIRKVYSLLTAQLLLTCAIAAPICTLGPVWAASNQWLLAVSMVVMMVTFCSMMCFAGKLRSYPTNYIFLFLITSAMSVLVGFTSAMYTWQSVILAAGITTGIFLLMTVYAWNTTQDFTGMGPYLMAAFFSLMMFGFALGIMRMCGVQVQGAMMMYDVCAVMLFTFYIVFDTQLIMGEYGGHKNGFSVDDYVFAALQLYLDIINLFLHILKLVGERR
eukprot:TRINITY_DN56645_c0_g1_i1.p2 TRINITY_DN56645_c0_g1~~TRINITY_DN56645_c0_g1_i1.p2  ORF type:complete len:243 (+),score=64.25 TRINITY_DN56645_c0_g1_i1:73-801(+)